MSPFREQDSTAGVKKSRKRCVYWRQAQLNDQTLGRNTSTHQRVNTFSRHLLPGRTLPGTISEKK
jgi:hypothetical protein